jgi:hypothetical protein
MAETRYLRSKDGRFAGSIPSLPAHAQNKFLKSTDIPPLFELPEASTEDPISAAHRKYLDKVGIEDATRATLAGEKEDQILSHFVPGSLIEFEGRSYGIITSDKPFSQDSKGEPKTDIYMLLEDRMSGETREVKITYKSANYQFLENKMSGARFFSIFNKEEQKEILRALPQNERVNREFEITTDKLLEPESKLTLGYRLDIMSSDTTGYMPIGVSQETMTEILAGDKLDDNKKHGVVNGKVVENSGVANYILIGDDFNSSASVLSNMVAISDYVAKDENRLISLAPKAVNMIPSRAKHFGGDKVKPWDGNRPLAISLKWTHEGDKLVGRPDTKTLFKKWAHQIGDDLLEKVANAVSDN